MLTVMILYQKLDQINTFHSAPYRCYESYFGPVAIGCSLVACGLVPL